MIKISALCAGYNHAPVLEGLDLRLKTEKIYALIGPSGCGKSTLLKILCGILKAQSGKISFDDQAWDKADISIAYAPQNYGLLEWKNVQDNIFLPLELRKNKFSPEKTKEITKAAREVISILGISEILKRYPSELSGGQRQRVSLARAFSLKPDLMLMDEPFSALDAFSAKKSQDLFLRLHELWKATTLFITHSIDEALKVGQEILIMDGQHKKIAAKLKNPYFAMDFMEDGEITFDEFLEFRNFKKKIRENLIPLGIENAKELYLL